MAKNNEVLNKQIAEVRRILDDIVHPRSPGYFSRLGMDRRIGYALSRKGVTRDAGDSWMSSHYSDYKFATMPDGRLKPDARLWIEVNGMKDLADAFDTLALRRYVTEHTAGLRKQRAKLTREIAEIDSKIAEYEAMLPVTE